MMKLIVGAIVALAASVYGQDIVARCGPWYNNQACPFNANGLGGQLYCTRFGYCSAVASEGSSSGTYTQMENNCIEQADMNAFCNSQLSGATCSYAEKRCQVTGLDPKKFDGLSGSGTTTTTTTTTGTTTTMTSLDSNAPPTASSSSIAYPLIFLFTIVAMIVGAVNL